MGPLWIAKLARPCLPKEILTTMGFNVFPQASFTPMHSFSPTRRSSLKFFIGNAMHLPCATMVIATALSCVRRRTDSDVMDDVPEDDLVDAFERHIAK
jgi:hypothetical protein